MKREKRLSNDFQLLQKRLMSASLRLDNPYSYMESALLCYIDEPEVTAAFMAALSRVSGREGARPDGE